MGPRIPLLALAAGLGFAGGAVILETLPTASSGPSGRVRPWVRPAHGPPPNRAPGPGVPAPVPAPGPPRGTSSVISGWVVDEEGVGLEFFDFYGGPRRSRGHHQGTCWLGSTGPGGAFSVEGARLLPLEGRGHLLRFWSGPNFLAAEIPADSWNRGVIEAGGSLRDLRIVVRRAATISGRVLREDGMPVPGARVRLLGPGDEVEEQEAGTGGFFVFRQLDPRFSFRLEAGYEGFRSETTDLGALPVPGERLERDIEIPGLDRRWYEENGRLVVSGVVVDGEGSPIDGARVGGNWIRCMAGTGADPYTLPDGRFEATLVEMPEPGEVLCEVRAEGYGTRAVIATRAFEGLRIVLRPGAAVAGRVLTPEGEAIEGATIEITDEPEAENPPTAAWERFSTDEAGAFRVPDIDPEWGRFLVATAEGRRRGVLPLRGRLVEGRDYAFDFVLEPLPAEE